MGESIVNDTTYDHAITVNEDGTALRFTCRAASGAKCRQFDCTPESARPSEAAGSCGALFFFDPCRPGTTYIGTTAQREWRSGPIEVEWGEEYGHYLWRFPGEERDLPMDPQLPASAYEEGDSRRW